MADPAAPAEPLPVPGDDWPELPAGPVPLLLCGAGSENGALPPALPVAPADPPDPVLAPPGEDEPAEPGEPPLPPGDPELWPPAAPADPLLPPDDDELELPADPALPPPLCVDGMETGAPPPDAEPVLPDDPEEPDEPVDPDEPDEPELPEDDGVLLELEEEDWVARQPPTLSAMAIASASSGIRSPVSRFMP